MTVTPLFEATGIGKRYRIGREKPLADLLRRGSVTWSWVLRGVDIKVDPGEIVAVIGRNGAGKSTLLKLAAGVTEASEGTIRRPFRIAPLIEVSAGFHPELTGRENVLINGQLLGLTSKEVAAAFDDIVSFAQLERAIDQPVRQYSSGMFMRLGFSVAIHTQPELLIVDEVLAVGDLPFQVRCLDRIRAMRADGVGVLFVSHNLTAVLNLADRAVLLEAGRLHSEGGVSEIVAEYHDVLATGPSEAGIGEDVPPTNELLIEELTVTTADGGAPGLWSPGDRAVIELHLRAASPTPEGILGFRVVKEGAGMVANWRAEGGPYIPPLETGETVRTRLDVALNLAEGAYVMDVAVARRDWTALMANRNNAARFGIGVRRGAAGIADLAPALEVTTEAPP